MRKTLLMTTMIVSGLAIAGSAGAADIKKDMRNDSAVNSKTEMQMKTGVHTDGAVKTQAGTDAQFKSYTHADGFKGTIVGGYSADELIGTNVIGPDGNTIGEIDDLLIDSNNQVSRVLVDVGGFLGIGEKKVAMELSELTRTDDGFRTVETEAQLESRVSYVEDNDSWLPFVGDNK